VRWVRAHARRYGGDPDRIVLAGHSAGAYNAAMLSLDPRWLGQDRTAVRGFVGLAGPYDFLPFDGPATRAAFGDAPEPQATQPVRFASAGDPPSLLLVAGKDKLVSPRNARNLAAALRRAGVPAEVRTYEQLGHVGILTALSRLFRAKAPVLRDVAEFARQAAAAQPEAIAPAA
jgi:acetyl esterase/lipase